MIELARQTSVGGHIADPLCLSTSLFPRADMRKPLPKDVNRQSIRANGRSVRVKPSDVWF